MATAKLKQDIRFERITGTVGAIVHGVGLTDSRCATTADTLRRALHEYGVLFFEFGRYLSRDEYVEFGHLFGDPDEGYPIKPKEAKETKGYLDSELFPMKEYRINFWHSDGTPFECPPQTAMLTPVELPEAGGDTMWASMYATWEALAPHYQRLLEGMEVVHSMARLPLLDQSWRAVHPAVIRDPVTGRKMLFVNSNYSERIVGLSDKDSESLLQMLFEHINTPEFHIRLRWRPGIVAAWDQRVTQHRGVADFVGPRKLRRLNFAPGDRPAP